MMEDYNALNHEAHIPLKHTFERTQSDIEQHVSNEIKKEFDLQTKEQKLKFIENMYHDQQITGVKIPHTTEELKERYKNPPKELQGNMAQVPADHQEYADDTILHMETKGTQDLLQQLNRYHLVTKGRKIPINWNKTEILTKTTKREKTPMLPPPYQKIQYKQEGQVLGKTISMRKNTLKPYKKGW